MKFFTLATLAAAASALPSAKPRVASSPESFSVVAARSASPIHFLTLNAANSHFYLGGKPSSYCPEQVPGCTEATQTVLIGDNALNVAVPGGQQIYVDPTGALSFTTPHSGYTPPGSTTTGFKYEAGKNGTLGHWSFGNGFMACPVNSTAPGKPHYQVYAARNNATVPGGNVKQCLGFDAMAVKGNGTVGAWEYI
ncbi:hypothetical protein BDV25DRAFT_138631 [Aspergillus avenaceus]|uniref:IgE-binding protein n=1 Tax=Aspergillus avenaceus TaxID=36643 RepID=A0A5N6TZA0_ASPAV|nr:hypothetical protein BDV25DRAFT_138631 [Aspergillus avenaceus]